MFRFLSISWLRLIFVLVLSLAGLPQGLAAQQLIWGANGHPFTAYPGIGLVSQLKIVNDLGLKSYRVNISSIDFVPALRTLVDSAKALDIEILPVLTPPLDLENDTVENLHRKAKAFTVHYISRFKDEIRVWELGNELENFAIIQPCEMQDDGVQYNCNWGPAGGVGPLEYYGPRWAKVSAVMKGMSEGAISVDPAIRKAMGTAGWGHIGAFERMRHDGIEWDISVWHFYGNDLEWGLEQLAPFGKPVWLTEFNHPLGSKKGEDEQATGLASIMRQVKALKDKYDIEAAHIYELLDESYWAPDFEAYMGLVRLEKDGAGWTVGAQKPAYCEVREIVHEELADQQQQRRQCDLCKAGAQMASPETRVQYSYCLLLDRPADGEGIASWTASLSTGMKPDELLVQIFQSAEAEQKYRISSLSDSEFIRFVFQLLLRRESDHKSLADYLSQISAGKLSRKDLVQAIVTSDEFLSKNRILFAPS